MLTRIDDIYLYTDIDWDSGDIQESHMAVKFLEENGITFTLMNYNGSDQLKQDAITPLRTWIFNNGDERSGMADIKGFPFLIYTEVHDDLAPSRFPKSILLGYDEILESNILELYQIGR